jgi:hypothetical protein
MKSPKQGAFHTMRILTVAALSVAVLVSSTASADAQTKYFARQKLTILTSTPATEPKPQAYDGTWTPQTTSGTGGACLKNNRTTTYQPTCTAKNGSTDASMASCDPATKAASVRTSSEQCYSTCPVPVIKPNRIINTTYQEVIASYPLSTGTIAQVAVLAKPACEKFGLGSMYKVRICQVAREAGSYTVSMMITVNPPVDSTPASNVYWSECTYESIDN